jgi:hypothetical protein
VASIELSPLTSQFDKNEIKALEAALVESGSSPLDIDADADTQLLERDLDDDLLAELFDRLDVNDAACDVYVPPDFEDSFTIGDHTVGSAHALLLALQELSEELGVAGDDDEEFEEDEDYDGEDFEDEDADDEDADEAYELRDQELRRICKVLQSGAKLSIRRGVAMFVHTGRRRR